MIPNDNHITGILIDEDTTFSLEDVCSHYNISETLLHEMQEHGLLQLTHATLDSKTFYRIQTASRLHEDLGVNLPGIMLVLDLLDDLEHTRNELMMLQRHMTIKTR